MDKKVSIIVVYNNIDKLNEAITYIESQTMVDDVEVVAIDNRHHEYESAAKALNYGADISHGEVLIFMHQDMLLLPNDTVEKYYTMAMKHQNAILGVAGYTIDKKTVFSDLYEQKEKKRILPSPNGVNYLCYSHDESIFAMKRTRFEELRFNETICNDWHLYGVEICYHNMSIGGENVLLSLPVWHKCTPYKKLPKGYFSSLKKFIKEYKGKYAYVYAPCSTLKCNIVSFYLFLLKKELVFIKQKILGRK